MQELHRFENPLPAPLKSSLSPSPCAISSLSFLPFVLHFFLAVSLASLYPL